MAEPALNNVVEWTVSELSAALKRTVEDEYGYVRVRGEISGFKGPHSSGHCYFALKDEGARLEAVIWRTAFGRMRVKPEEGLEVIVTGRLTTYPGRSSYQIVIDSLEPAGIGALMKLLEERKKKLAAEGLFDEARKQLLPYLPEVIGVVTSPTGAVIRDILHRLEDRFPRRVLVWPVRVQGDTSAAEVARAIHGFNALPERGPIPRPGLIIVARGGGSLEDLWSFNEEIVVRAAAASMIPLISAVGHLGARKFACWRRNVDRHRKELFLLSRALPAIDDVLAIPRQRLDSCAGRLPRALRANAQIHHTHLTRVASRLSPRLLSHRIERCKEQTVAFGDRTRRAFRIFQDRRTQRLLSAGQLLTAYSYRGVLERGFALVRDGDGRPLRSTAAVDAGMRLDIEFSDGRVAATADGDRAAQPVAKPKPRTRGSGEGPAGQGSLFGS